LAFAYNSSQGPLNLPHRPGQGTAPGTRRKATALGSRYPHIHLQKQRLMLPCGSRI